MIFPLVQHPGMLGKLQWLALEVKYLDRVQAFYEAFLDLEVRHETDREVAFAAGDTALVLRAPGDPPRGGLHTRGGRGCARQGGCGEGSARRRVAATRGAARG